MTSEKCVECGSFLKVYDINFQTGRKVMRCEQCGLLHIYKKDRLHGWHIVRVTRRVQAPISDEEASERK
jgi:uncharacterized Zn finger protein